MTTYTIRYIIQIRRKINNDELNDGKVFNEAKATALAGLLVGNTARANITFIRLMKLMYFCERQKYRLTGEFITNDTFYSMQNGPILSHTYNLAKEEIDGGLGEIWSKHFRRDSETPYYIELTEEISLQELKVLDDFEQKIADTYSMAFRTEDDFELARLSHKICSEWQNPGNGRLLITEADIKKATDKDDAFVKKYYK